MKLEPENIPELIEYNGWTIWGWTGWKGTKSVLHHNIPAERTRHCLVCDLPLLSGQTIKAEQSLPPRHWLCAHPDNPPDRLMGQWLAVKGSGPTPRYMEVNVDNLVAGFIDGCEYKRGDSFPVSTEGTFITEHTPDAQREIAKQIGLQRLKYLIDQVEAQEVEAE